MQYKSGYYTNNWDFHRYLANQFIIFIASPIKSFTEVLREILKIIIRVVKYIIVSHSRLKKHSSSTLMTDGIYNSHLTCTATNRYS